MCQVNCRSELLARANANALHEKQRLQEANLKLKMKEEKLELKTHIEVPDARTKILEDIEKSMVEDQQLEKDTCM